MGTRRSLVRLAVESVLTAGAFVGLQRLGLLAPVPVWVLLGLLGAAAVVSSCAYTWWGAESSGWRLHARVAVQVAGITVVIYATGWGPMLAVGYAIGAADNFRVSGSRATIPVIGWSLAGIFAGQVAIALGVAPTLVGEPLVQGLAALMALGIGFMVHMLGSSVAEKEAAERGVQASEHRLRHLVAYAADAVAIVDSEGTVTYVSPAVEQLTGFPAEEFVGRQMRHLGHPDDLAQVAARFPTGERPKWWRGDLRVRHRSGSWRWCQITVTDLLDDVAVRGVVVNAHDVTERREAEEALARAEARFRSLVQSSADGILVLDASGKFTYVSPSYERLTGLHPEDLSGTSAAGLAHPDDVERLAAAWAELLASPEGVVTVEARAATADASWRWQELAFTNMLGDPAVEGIILNVRDVTDRKRAEELLAEEARIHEKIAQGAPLSETLTALCCLVEGTIRDSSCAILLLDATRSRLHVAAAPSLPPAFVRAIDGMASEPAADGGGATTHPGHALVVTDLPVPVPSEMRDALRFGLQASWSVPITGAPEGEILGTLVLYRQRRASPSESDLRLVERFVPLAAVAIEHAHSASELLYQARHDVLTGLPNRWAFLDRLRRAADRSTLRGSRLAVLFLDLDRFKLVNDSFGHDGGDRLLAAVAARLRCVIRARDAVARFGGDEFVILRENVKSEQAVLDVVRRLEHAFAEPFELDGQRVYQTLSIGAAVGVGGHDPELLVRQADAAMYRAKERGRARVELFDETREAPAASRLETTGALHQGIKRGELVVHYQPIVDLRTACPVGTEALVRWRHPERGLLLPGEFIDLAEDTGLIVPLGSLVLDQACADLARWRREVPNGDEFWMNVNISPRQLADPSLVDSVVSTATRHGIPTDRLMLELTESALVDDIDATLEILRQLRDSGVRLSLDDFGTGYSSLTHLRRFPVSALKVDRSFVANLRPTSPDSALAGAIVAMGRALGLSVVAEGIETYDQLVQLRQWGCEHGQGYYFARPQPAERVLELLVRGLEHRVVSDAQRPAIAAAGGH